MTTRPFHPAVFAPVVRPAVGPVLKVMMFAREAQGHADQPAFFQPFSRLGWNWDTGWIVLYMAVYLAAMVGKRWALRVA